MIKNTTEAIIIGGGLTGLTLAYFLQKKNVKVNNGNLVYRQSYWGGRLFIAGSETAAAHPGYMDGAVNSAQWVNQQITG